MGGDKPRPYENLRRNAPSSPGAGAKAREDRAAIETVTRALVDGQTQPKFVLDTDLNHLSLGSRTVMVVVLFMLNILLKFPLDRQITGA